MHEDNYELMKVHLANIVENIESKQIIEIWKLVLFCGTKTQYVILMTDGSHICTCNLLITHGYPCRHFYKILHCSFQAKWHIGLIARRWYKDNVIKETPNKIWEQSSISLCTNEIQNEDNHIIEFRYLKEICESDVYTPVLQEINSTQQKYGRVQGIMRKVLDLAIYTNSYDELIGICQNFILDKQQIQEPQKDDELNIENPRVTARKGRRPGRAKSTVEIQDNQLKKRRYLQPVNMNQTVNDPGTACNGSKEKDTHKTCQNCRQKGHNKATCKN
ncbi:hypothetical protein C2G38_2270667 [Gigaspora rosea]|uniref:SWIM-type domain-containing protein n=1 Tax=Gigaspora rosea TaxID=44941 RepID=A0A397UG75_9GLOM|nr:hypothetical protein C2G38_2270667 [Gigaspora rosea]